MTLLGKVFTVLIFIMSLVFMSFAVAVYATHKNWKDLVTRTAEETGPGEQIGLQPQLEAAQDAFERLNEEKIKVEQQLAMEKAARRQALAALEARARQLGEQLAVLEARNAQLVQSEREAMTAMESTQRNLVAIKDEVSGLRTRIRDVQLDRDGQFQRVVSLTDQVNQAKTVKARLEETKNQLTDELSRRREVMQRHKLSADEPADKTPPPLDGVVTAISKDFVEISLGSDDGIRDGHQLDVFNNKSFLGRIKIRRTAPNRAVGQIVPEYKKGEIKKGDRVATKLTG
jgi:DNA repair exonuclease SbcCD ATPase subunit